MSEGASGKGMVEAAAAVEGVCRAAAVSIAPTSPEGVYTTQSRPADAGTCTAVAVLDALMALMAQMLSVSLPASQVPTPKTVRPYGRD
jgi:hypothetical protein